MASELRIAVEIDSPTLRVWETLVDVERWPEWTKSVTAAHLLDGGPLVPGARVRIRQPLLPALTWEVTDLQPGQSFVWRASSTGVTTLASHTLRQLDAGGTEVVLALRQSGSLASLLGRMSAGRIRRYMQMEADGLKRRCEPAAVAEEGA